MPDIHMARLILLSRGLAAMVDDVDFDRLAAHRWFASKHSHTFYAKRTVPTGTPGKRRSIYMHREIMGLGSGSRCDHQDGDGLNNRRENLRTATQSQNLANSRVTERNTSGFKGVSWDKTRHRWQSGIKINGRRKALGRYDTAEEAHAAYCAAARQLFGEFARLQ